MKKSFLIASSKGGLLEEAALAVALVKTSSKICVEQLASLEILLVRRRELFVPYLWLEIDLSLCSVLTRLAAYNIRRIPLAISIDMALTVEEALFLKCNCVRRGGCGDVG